jgi:Skp family chaperone for outer membrane proteins
VLKRLGTVAAWVALCLWAAPAALAQDDPAAPRLGTSSAATGGQVPGGRVSFPFGAILVLNQDVLLTQSLYGQRIQQEIEAASQALANENRQIEAELAEEELRLTDLRASMETSEFRALATEFDSRVEAIRAAQIAKERSLQTQVEAAQARFFDLAFPVLLELVEGRGGSVLLDSRSILLAADGVDITADAIRRIDAEIGAGGDAPLIVLGGRAAAGPVQRPEAP